MPLVFALDQPLPFSPEEAARAVGGKAAGLNVMSTRLDLPVPPAFVLTTKVCREVVDGKWPSELDGQIREHLGRMEQQVGRSFGGADNPLLVSVRSGAPVSMPGMMDTILNLGLTETTAKGLARATADESFAQDCLDRFRAMFRSVVMVTDVPEDPWTQLRMAIESVFRSWHSERAQAYRAIEGIPDDLGTAVIVQAMVFGNTGPESATGVLFTRDPSTGGAWLTGDVLFDAQGEDVVGGTHHTHPVAELGARMPSVASTLQAHARTLENHFHDMCDIEFTIERGTLWLLQTRIGKRSPRAALTMAVEMAQDPNFPLSRKEAVFRVAGLLANPPSDFSPGHQDVTPIALGRGASPGVATGLIATGAAAVEELAANGHPVILVRPDTSPQDVPIMGRSAGVLTARGGPASHAAVVARGWGIPAVVGASAVGIHGDGIVVNGRRYDQGETLTIDGATGEVFAGEVRGRHVPIPQVATLLSWAAELGIEIPPLAGTEEGSPHSTMPSSTAKSDPPASGDSARDTAGDASLSSDLAGVDDVVSALFIKTIASVEQIADALNVEPSHLESLADQLVHEGLLRRTDAASPADQILRLTDIGIARADQLLDAARDRCGSGRADAALLAFDPHNQRLKAAVTAWQMREIDGTSVINDHGDAAYDATVLSQVADLHGDVVAWLDELRGGVPPLSGYLGKLERAATAITEGDHRYVASPRVESYHSVWFELHEYLIRLAGRTRETETAAGRA